MYDQNVINNKDLKEINSSLEIESFQSYGPKELYFDFNNIELAQIFSAKENLSLKKKDDSESNFKDFNYLNNHSFQNKSHPESVSLICKSLHESIFLKENENNQIPFPIFNSPPKDESIIFNDNLNKSSMGIDNINTYNEIIQGAKKEALMIFNIEKNNDKKLLLNQFYNNQKLKVFNYDIFKINYEKRIFSIEKHFPILKDLKDIIANNRDLHELWDKYDIFKDENDLLNMENEKNVRNILYYFKEKKKYKCSKEMLCIDIMYNIIKTYVQKTIFDSVNSYDKFKNNELSIPKKNKINKPIKAEFNLEYLRKPLFSIISNDSSKKNEKSNYEKVDTIVKEYIENKNDTDLINHFLLTVQYCLDILRNKKEKIGKYQYRFVDFLIEENEKCLKGERKIPCHKKEYIASLIILFENYELFFYIRGKQGRKFREQKSNH